MSQDKYCGRDMRKLKWQYEVRNMPKKRMPVIVHRDVWEKVTKGPAGIRWENVVDKVWKHIGGNQEEMVSAGKFGRHETEVEERIERRARLTLRNTVKSEKHLGLSKGIGMKTYLTSRKG